MGLVVKAAEPGAELGAHSRVEGAERLVEEQHRGVDGERAREPHPLALTARELRRVAVGEPLELDELEQLRTRSRISVFGRRRIESPKAMLSRTVMCLNAA